MVIFPLKMVDFPIKNGGFFLNFSHGSPGLERELQLLGVPGQFETLHGGANREDSWLELGSGFLD